MGVATAVAVGGLVVSAATTTKSFIDADKQKKLQKEAEQDAKAAMDEARKKLEVNFYDQMAVKKEPYELEREAMLSQGAQAIQAGQESERGAAATAGRVQMAMNEGQAGIRTAMGKEMTDIEKLQLGEKSRLRDIGVQLDLEEVAGAQLAARDAQEAAAAATAQGWAGVESTAQQALQMVPLYTKTPSAREAQRIENTAMGTKEGQYALSQSDMQKSVASLGTVNGYDFSKVANMTPMEYDAFMSSVDKNTLKQVKSSLPTIVQSFNPNQNTTVPYGNLSNISLGSYNQQNPFEY